MFWELQIQTEDAKSSITRLEYFTGTEQGAQEASDRRTFLKGNEKFGSSNTYRLRQVNSMERVQDRCWNHVTY